MLKFPSIDKTHGGGIWRAGPDTTIDPRHVVAIEPREHRYSLDHAVQMYAVVHLSTGAVIEAMATSGSVYGLVIEAMAEVANARAGLMSQEGQAVRAGLMSRAAKPRGDD